MANYDDDLLVQSRFKNNRLWQLMNGRSSRECALKCGISPQSFGGILNLKLSPFSTRDITDTPHYNKTATSIADFCRVPPEDLFPTSLYALNLPELVERSYSSAELLPLMAARGQHSLLPSPVQSVEENDLDNKLDYLLRTLKPRTARILKLRFGLEDGVERTLEEVAKIFGLSSQRIRQIEYRGLRSLRHPSRSMELLGCLDKDERPKVLVGMAEIRKSAQTHTSR